MPGFKTFASGAILTAADVNDYLMEQAVIQATTGTRPGSPHEGMVVASTDTNALEVYSGSAWLEFGRFGAAATWTPVVTQSYAVGATINHAVYFTIGKLVVAWFRITIPSPNLGAASNAVTVSLPVTAARADMVAGTGFIFDASASLGYSGSTFLATTTTCDFRQHGTGTAAANQLGVAGFTAGITTDDIISGFLVFEAA
jgi:hypothetical protein